jgi:malate dehydrogenase
MLDKKMIMPCAVYLQGEYGFQNIFVGVPVKLGAGGVEQVIEIELNEGERAQLQKSADAVKELIGVMGI